MLKWLFMISVFRLLNIVINIIHIIYYIFTLYTSSYDLNYYARLFSFIKSSRHFNISKSYLVLHFSLIVRTVNKCIPMLHWLAFLGRFLLLRHYYKIVMKNFGIHSQNDYMYVHELNMLISWKKRNKLSFDPDSRDKFHKVGINVFKLWIHSIVGHKVLTVLTKESDVLL